MGIHHSKHHQAYVNNLNAALESHPELQDKTAIELIVDLDAIPEDIRLAVRNHGGGHVNHSLFWTVMSPKGGGEPSGGLGDDLTVLSVPSTISKPSSPRQRRRSSAAAGPGSASARTATLS